MTRKRAMYHKDLRERLKDPAYAVEYLEAAVEEKDMPAVFLLALRNVAEARGMTRLGLRDKTPFKHGEICEIFCNDRDL